jgi:hypothetical protein
MATQAIPLSPVGGIVPKVSGVAISYHVEGLQETPSVRELSAKCAPSMRTASVVQGEKTPFLHILFN